MPAVPGASSGAGMDGVEQGEYIALEILWKGRVLLDVVYLPSKDDFLYDPGGVAFAELLERDWLFLRSVVLVVWSEEVVNGVKLMSRHLPPFHWPSLKYTDEVI